MPQVNADLDWAIEDLKRRQPNLRLFKEYDEGDHRLTFATEKFRNAFGNLFQEFADNLCDDVVNAITDRIQITAWTSKGDDQGLAKAVEAAWTLNRGPSRMGSVHRHAFRDGDGYAMVQDGKDGKARIWKQDPRQISVRWDDEDPDEMAVAARIWKVGTRYRINLMYPDRLERWASKGSTNNGGLPSAASFRPLAPGDALLKADVDATQPWDSIPLYHFPNGDVSCYGRSILLPVIPLQDALNKSIADMLVAMEFHAYPQRWATGITVKTNPVTGQEIDPFQAGEGRVWWSSKEGGQFGQFDPAAMEGFLGVQKSFRLEIARKGAMPAFDLNGDSGGTPPSGVALLVAEGRTVKMGRDRIRDWEPEEKRMMADVASRDLGTKVLPDDLDLEWAPVGTRDMKALLEELALKKDLGVPTEQILEEMGYGPTEVSDFLDDLDAENEAQQVASAVLTGGRQSVLTAGAMTLGQQLGVPGAPVPPAGGATPLAPA